MATATLPLDAESLRVEELSEPALMRELNDTLNVLHQDGDQPDRAEKKNITKS